MPTLISPPSAALALHHDTTRELLPNGLTLLVRRDVSAPVVSIVTYVKAGYFDESDDVVGIAHVLEHMFFKGTPTRGVGHIARETKANGGYLNAHTIYDHTSYFTVLPSSSFVQGLEIQFDAYARSVIDGEELSRELEVIIQEVKRKRDTASAVTIESLYALLFDTHRIRRWRMGEEDALRDFTRGQLVAFYRRWYRPSNTILSIVGDVDPDVVRREVLARHGALEDSPLLRDPTPAERAAPSFRVREWAGDIAQQHIAFGWRTPGMTHADAPALELAGIALSAGRASRFYRALRERQLVSSVSAWDYTTGDIGVFVAHAETPAEQGREAARYLWRELHAARTVGLRRSEITRAQSIVEARWLRSLESMDGQASYLAGWEAIGGLEFASRYYDTLLSLTPEQVRDALERHCDPSQAAVISYRPNGAESLADSAESLRELLRAEEGLASSVIPSADLDTPPHVRTIEAPALHLEVRAERVEAGVHVYRTVANIPILVLPRRGAPLVNIGVIQSGGSLLDADDREGLARLAAQVMLKGTTTRTGARIAEASEALGSSIGASTSLESASWSLSVPARHFGTAVELLSDVLQRAVFPDQAVDTERALAIAEIARARDDMYRWPMRLAMRAAYGAHPYGRSVLGSEESLTAITADDLRGFHAARIRTGTSVIAMVGDVDPADASALVARAFAELQWRDETMPALPAWNAERSVNHERRDKQQTAIALLFPGPARRDADRFAAQVLSAIASGLGGRFFEQLRDRQSLAYTVNAHPVERRASGLFAAYIATTPAREEEAREGLLHEFAKLRREAPTPEEIERARRYIIGTHAIAQQSGGAVMSELVDDWLFGDGLHEPEALPARISAVQAEDVWRLATRYFDPLRVAEGVVRGHAESLPA